MRRSTLIRVALGAALAVPAAGAAGAFSLAMLDLGPRTAALPTSAGESAAAAALVDGRGDPARLAEAARLARSALARSPVNAEAARTLALVQAARGRTDAARRMIGYAEQVSRRDVATQVWLIEDRVQAADVTGALIHYYRAMQTSPASRDLLSPILAQAADSPAIARPLARILRTRPEWWSNFLGDFVERTHSPAALDMITRSLHLDPAVPVERVRLSTILQRYLALGEFSAGRRLFNRITGESGIAVADGGFEHDAVLAPYGWQLVETAAGAGLREPRNGAHGAFALTLDGADGQELARQVLTLKPGRYQLQLLAGGVRAGLTTPPNVALRCAPADKPIADIDLPIAGSTAVVTLDFAVPANCPAQLLIVHAAQAGAYLDEKPWIDDVAIRPSAEARHGV